MRQVIHARGSGGPVPVSIQGPKRRQSPRRSRGFAGPGSPAAPRRPRRSQPASPRSEGTQPGRSCSSFFTAYHQLDPRNPRQEPLRQARKGTRGRGTLGFESAGARDPGGAGRAPGGQERRRQEAPSHSRPLQSKGSHDRSSAPAPPRALPAAGPSGAYKAAAAGAGRAERAKGAGRGRTASREMEFCLKAPDAGKD